MFECEESTTKKNTFLYNPALPPAEINFLWPTSYAMSSGHSKRKKALKRGKGTGPTGRLRIFEKLLDSRPDIEHCPGNSKVMDNLLYDCSACSGYLRIKCKNKFEMFQTPG